MAHRVLGLLDAGALVTVVAAEADASVVALAGRGDLTWLRREYRPGDLRDAFLAINGTGDLAIEDTVQDEARHGGVLLNTIDRPAACDYATPAVVRRGRLQIAVSTSGDSPYVAATVRRRIERLFGEEWGTLLELVGRVRRRLRREGVDAARQQQVYASLSRDDVRTALRADRTGDVFTTLLTTAADLSAAPGMVHLVGAGPGDPGLLTVRARELLFEADVVFHDALVSAEVLAWCAQGAELVDVGKRGGGTQVAQEEITAQLIAAARSGRDVVRLKGGDPFVFGRGGEEMAALRAAGVTVEVVPGVSAAIAAPAAAGIPLTMRGIAGSFAVITGQDVHRMLPDKLEGIASCVDTLVVLMPMGALDEVSARLAPVLGEDWPAALIADATTAAQRVARAPLADLARAAQESEINAPATLVLGHVVNTLQLMPSGGAGRRKRVATAQ